MALLTQSVGKPTFLTLKLVRCSVVRGST